MESDFQLYKEREGGLMDFEEDAENIMIEGGDCAQSLGVVSDDSGLHDQNDVYEQEDIQPDNSNNPFLDTSSTIYRPSESLY